MDSRPLIWVRGAGELASAVAHLLLRVGFPVFLSEIDPPLAIRRAVSFSDAVFTGKSQVERVHARLQTSYTLPQSMPLEFIPLYIDDPLALRNLGASILVDARMLKQDLPDMRGWTPMIIGLGPGFDTERNCHRVIETQRGHDLGRVISKGSPAKDTGVPGKLGGHSSQRLVRAECSGHVRWQVNFGDLVQAGQLLGYIDGNTPVQASISGLVRGLIAERTPVFEGLKIGDIDPRGADVDYLKISDKARMVAAGVLEAILLWEKDQRL